MAAPFPLVSAMEPKPSLTADEKTERQASAPAEGLSKGSKRGPVEIVLVAI